MLWVLHALCVEFLFIPVDRYLPLWKVDLHAHTIYSKDCLTRTADFIERARAAGLDKIAVTEHNRLDGALAAKALAPDLIIVGEEIKTTHGEIIGYLHERRGAGRPIAGGDNAAAARSGRR